MENVHGRKNKSTTTFKAVLNKVLVSALILGTVAGVSTPVFAAELSIKEQVNGITVNQEIGVSVQDTISSLRNTINSINQMRANGSVSNSQIKTLANQLYSLEQVAKGLFSGKGSIIDGVGRFAPDDTMSRAEFVTGVIYQNP